MTPTLFAKCQKIAARFREEHGVKTGVRAEKKDETGDLYIYGPIGASFWSDGLSAKDVVDRLDELKGCKILNIYINSEGGDVFDGKAIYTALSRFQATKNVVIDGLAASAATVIAMAGDTIATSKGATWMIHEASGGAWGRAADLRAVADILDLENANIVDIYEARTKQPRAEIVQWMADETWMDAKTAKERGFCDSIVDVSEEQDTAAVAAIPIAAGIRRTQELLASNPLRARLVAEQAGVKLDQLKRRASPAPRTGQPERTSSTGSSAK